MGPRGNNRLVQPGLWVCERENGVLLWLAVAHGITLYSYSEAYAREWLARELGGGPEAA